MSVRMMALGWQRACCKSETLQLIHDDAMWPAERVTEINLAAGPFWEAKLSSMQLLELQTSESMQQM